MKRRSLVIGLIAAAVVAVVGIGVYLASASAVGPVVVAVAGSVRAETYVVRAPVITLPSPDYAVGITVAGTPAPKKRPTAAGAPMSSRAPVVSGYLAEVLVAQGSRVTTGQVLARLDTTFLDLGVAAARAAADKARADLEILDHNGVKLSDARAKLVKGRDKLTSVRASLAATITVLVARRASLETSIAAIQALIAQPGGPPPHVPPYPVILAGLQSALTGLNVGLTGAKVGLATIDKSLAKMAKGLRTMDSAMEQILGAHDLLVVNIAAQGVGVRLAEARQAQATITSPVSGVVTFARLAGTTVMVGAPLARVRPDRPILIDTYLTAEQLALVAIGTPVTVDFDSNTRGPLTGHISVIGSTAVVPPTSFPTAIVHMTRAVHVTVELDAGQATPAGTPVDLEIRTGSAR